MDIPTVCKSSRIDLFTHSTGIVECQHPGSDFWPKLPFITSRHFCEICLFLAWRVVFLFAKLNVLCTNLYVLHDYFFIPLKLCILWQLFVIYLQHLSPVYPDLSLFDFLVMRFRL